MKRSLSALVALLALTVPSLSFAINDTPAPTPAGTPTVAATSSPDGGSVKSQSVPAEPSARSYSKAQTFEGGLQIGSTASGASQLDFVKRVKCTINPVAMTLPGQTELIQCAATGALAGDFVSCRLPIASASGVVIKSTAAETDLIDIEFVAISDSFADLGAVDLSCLVVR